MAISRLSTKELDQISENGYLIVPSLLDATTICELSDVLDAGHAGVRNLLDIPAIRRLASSRAVRSPMEPVLGSNCFAVRGILFNRVGEGRLASGLRDCGRSAEGSSGLGALVN